MSYSVILFGHAVSLNQLENINSWDIVLLSAESCFIE